MANLSMAAVVASIQALAGLELNSNQSAALEAFLVAKRIKTRGETPAVTSYNETTTELFVLFPKHPRGRLKPFLSFGAAGKWQQVEDSGRKTVWNVSTRNHRIARLLFRRTKKAGAHVTAGFRSDAVANLATLLGEHKPDRLALEVFLLRDYDFSPPITASTVDAAFQRAYGIAPEELEQVTVPTQMQVDLEGPDQWEAAKLPLPFQPTDVGGGVDDDSAADGEDGDGGADDLAVDEEDGGGDEPTADEDEDGDVLNPTKPLSYTKSRFQREATGDEAGLRIADYVDVMRELLGNAEGEFTFALFGHWGRGKTYLMRRLASRLEAGRRRTIFFSSWKYPTAPEVWVHLYDTIAQTANDEWFGPRLARNFRAGLIRYGAWPLFLILMSFAATVAPFWQRIETAKRLLPIVGLFGLVFLVKLYLGGKRTVRQVVRQYLLQPRHDEHLGLQAVIGKDLKALLKAWIVPRRPSLAGLPKGIRNWAGSAGLYVAGVLAVWLALRPHPGPDRLINVPFLGPTPEYLPHLLYDYVGVAWLLLAAGLLPLWFLGLGYGSGKLLLVVDDLDRCEPTQMVSIVESLKVLLEDEEIADRLQVVMLLEEGVLRTALLRKYRILLRDRNEPELRSEYNADRIWQESVEKLFVAHLRLPLLTSDDAREVMDLLTKNRGRHYRPIDEDYRPAAGPAFVSEGAPSLPASAKAATGKDGDGPLLGGVNTAPEAPAQQTTSGATAKPSPAPSGRTSAETEAVPALFRATRYRPGLWSVLRPFRVMVVGEPGAGRTSLIAYLLGDQRGPRSLRLAFGESHSWHPAPGIRVLMTDVPSAQVFGAPQDRARGLVLTYDLILLVVDAREPQAPSQLAASLEKIGRMRLNGLPEVLPVLSKADTDEGARASSIMSRQYPEAVPVDVRTGKGVKTVSTKIIDRARGSRGDDDVVFDEDDKAALKDIAPLLVQQESAAPCGPRSIRNFAFKYQLAKLLLHREAVAVTPARLTYALAEAAGYRVRSGELNAIDGRAAATLDRVAQQVSLLRFIDLSGPPALALTDGAPESAGRGRNEPQ